MSKDTIQQKCICCLKLLCSVLKIRIYKNSKQILTNDREKKTRYNDKLTIYHCILFLSSGSLVKICLLISMDYYFLKHFATLMSNKYILVVLYLLPYHSTIFSTKISV